MPNHKRLIEYAGKSQTLDEWAAKSAIPGRGPVPAATLRSRIDCLGWTVAEALTTPADPRFRRGTGRPRAGVPRPCPELKRHTSGRAWCRWKSGGMSYSRYFGAYGSTEAAGAYKRFQVEWAEGLAEVRSASDGVTVAELAVAYLDHAERYYRKDGQPTGELPVIRAAVAELVRWAGDMRAVEIHAEHLEGLQAALAARKLSRNTVNGYIARSKRLFEWAHGRRGENKRPLVPADVLLSVRSVRELRAGRSAAKESAAKRAVPWADVAATLPHLSAGDERRAVLSDLIRCHWLTGMRPGELLRMRPADVNRKGKVWRYVVPGGGKVAHLGRVGVYWIGPKAQKILRPYLKTCPADRPVFVLPSRSEGGAPVRITRDAYRRFIALAASAAGVPHWHPHQLRHSRATEVQRIYESNADAAKAIGTSEEVAREVYIDPNESVRRRIAQETG
jgi:integrase